MSPDQQTRERWRKRYETGVERLKAAGIKTTQDGVENYLSLRKQWDRYITLLAPKFAYDMNEIDTALAKVKQTYIESDRRISVIERQQKHHDPPKRKEK